ncbi:CHASE2 domain-containing protein [Lutimaribacter marinistellae]|uniref:CHASE2 domain-containing protein n=1 Tax=Lutimaribacter marinistellae TaxID=1820329 RepID=A0ABV7TJI1_9RHOB
MTTGDHRVSRRRRALGRLLPLTILTVSALLFGAAWRIAEPEAAGHLRNIAYDEYQKWHPRNFDPDLPVRIVAIDEASLTRLGQWPWPRSRLAELVMKLGALGAATVALDIVLAEPDRMSPDQIASLVDDDAERARVTRALAALPDGDARMADALESVPSVLGIALTNEAPRQSPGGLPPKAGFAVAGDPPQEFLPVFSGMTAPLPGLANAATGLAALNWMPGRDQIVRDVPLLFALPDGRLVPSLAVEALRVAQGASTFVVRSSNASGQSAMGARTGVNALRIGAFDVPTSPRGSLLLHYTPPQPERFIPAWRVALDDVSSDEIAGRIILIGATAPGLFDIQSTPTASSVPGIEINAQVIEHIITGTELGRPDWAEGLEFMAFATLVLFCAVLAAFFSPTTAVMTGVVTLAAVSIASYLAFARLDLFIDPTFPVIGSAITLFSTTSLVAIRERAERRWVREAFGHYVSRDLVRELEDDPEALALGGDLRPMSVLFSDVRGFTTAAEGMSAAQLTEFVNALFTALTDVIIENRGTIDKFMGDAVMAFWNAPLNEPDHAARACQTALEMLDALERFNAENAHRFPETGIGIGINTGECYVGNFGSHHRFDYSVIGDEVNVASRLEGQTRPYDVPILVGGATAKAARSRGYVLTMVDEVQVKGRIEPVEIYALLGGPDHPVDQARLEAGEMVERIALARAQGNLEAAREALGAARHTEFAAALAIHADALAAMSRNEGSTLAGNTG